MSTDFTKRQTESLSFLEITRLRRKAWDCYSDDIAIRDLKRLLYKYQGNDMLVGVISLVLAEIKFRKKIN